MLHVLQTVDSLSSANGGPSRTIVELSRALSRCDDTEVSILTADRQADSLIRGFSNKTKPSAPARQPGSVYRRVRLLTQDRRERRPVIHDNGVWLWSNVQAVMAARTMRIPVVISPHGSFEQWCMRHHGWRKRAALLLYQRRCLRSATAFHATSVLEASNIRALGLTQPIAIVPNGIELPPPAGSEFASSQRTALFLSRVHPKKGVLDLIDAWARVRPRHWTLRIVGPAEDGYRRRVADAIAANSLQSDVELRDEIDNDRKWDLFRHAQLFILPTYSENFGLVVGEALACGVPVITTNETPWTDLQSRGCGWVVSPGAQPLRAALSEATALTPERLREMGEVGRQWIPGEFSWEAIAQKMREFYWWVVDGTSHSRLPTFVTVM